MILKSHIKQQSNAGDFQQALNEVFDALKSYKGKAFKLTAFVNSKNSSDYIEQKQLVAIAINSCFENEIPTWSILSEAPMDAMLCVVLQCSDADKKHLDFKGLPIVILEQHSEKELWVSGLSSLDDDMKISATTVFETLSDVLKTHGFEYDDIVRQWNYIGEILKIKTHDGLNVQNYQVFNDIRNAYYRRNKKRSDFPAATGIGIKTPGLVVDIFAQKSGDEVQSLPLRSQVQKNPFAYSETVLVGDKSDKKPPLFERGRILYSTESASLPKLNHQAQILVSGTASIQNQETVAIGDVSAQTENTIQYIQELISSKNIQNNYSELNLGQLDYQRILVYVKNQNDMEIVSRICSAHFPKHLINLVEADICRDNLLVEIEADLG